MNQSFFRDFHYAPPATPDLPIIHRDDDILVLDKPAGLLTVAGKTPDLFDCLESRVREIFPRATIVHRLDMSTSGVIVMALNLPAHRHLSLQFEQRKTSKTYIAHLWGRLTPESGRVDLPMRCDWPNRPRQIIDHEQGRSAQTNWKVLSYDEAYSTTRITLSPITGRSHQLRVHMMSLGHPIIGDEFYAHDEAFAASTRLMLHAWQLTLAHPETLAPMTFEAPCPF